MDRRRRDDDWIWPIAQLMGLFVALGFICPPFRQVVVLAVAVVLVLGTYRLLARRGASQTFSFNASTSSATLAASDASKLGMPSTTEQLIQQLRSIDWFQFEQLVAHVYPRCRFTTLLTNGQLRAELAPVQ